MYTTAFLMLAYLSHQLGLAGVGDIILADVSMQPVAEIQEPVIQRDEDISNKTFKKIFSSKVRKRTGPATNKTTSLLSFKILFIVASEKQVKIWVEQTQSSLEAQCLLKGSPGSTSIPRTIPEHCELVLKDPNSKYFLEKLTSSIRQCGSRGLTISCLVAHKQG